MSRLLIERRADGVFHTMDDGHTISVGQEVGPILEYCAQARQENDRFRGFRKTEEFRHVASIPLALIAILKARGLDVLGDADDLFRFLNDPRYDAFRVCSGRI